MIKITIESINQKQEKKEIATVEIKNAGKVSNAPNLNEYNARAEIHGDKHVYGTVLLFDPHKRLFSFLVNILVGLLPYFDRNDESHFEELDVEDSL